MSKTYWFFFWNILYLDLCDYIHKHLPHSGLYHYMLRLYTSLLASSDIKTIFYKQLTSLNLQFPTYTRRLEFQSSFQIKNSMFCSTNAFYYLSAIWPISQHYFQQVTGTLCIKSLNSFLFTYVSTFLPLPSKVTNFSACFAFLPVVSMLIHYISTTTTLSFWTNGSPLARSERGMIEIARSIITQVSWGGSKGPNFQGG